MAVHCQSCGKKATLAYNRHLRFFPGSRRVLCDGCYGKVQKKEDLIFLGILFSVIFFVIAFVFTSNFFIEDEIEITNITIHENQNRLDLDKDGLIDFFESTVTEDMIQNLDSHGYPWIKILGVKEGKRPSFLVNRDTIIELFKNNNFHKLLNCTIKRFRYKLNVFLSSSTTFSSSQGKSLTSSFIVLPPPSVNSLVTTSVVLPICPYAAVSLYIGVLKLNLFSMK